VIKSVRSAGIEALVNDQWSICFRWADGHAHDVEIVDYHGGHGNMARKLLDPIPPGEILSEEFMKPLGVSMNALARDIDVPPKRVSEIVNGKRAITADTALRLGKYFGVSPEVWLGLQVDYDLRLAKRTTRPEIEPKIRVRAA
jgi:addiction module HigA family antidote